MTIDMSQGGKPILLALNTMTGVRFEELTGAGIDEAFDRLERGHLTTFVALVAAALGAGVGIKDAAALMDECGGAASFLIRLSVTAGTRGTEIRAALSTRSSDVIH